MATAATRWTDSEQDAFFRSTDLREHELRLVAFNPHGIGMSLLADKGRNRWVFHPLTNDLIRDSRPVGAAIRRALLVLSFRDEVDPAVYPDAIGEPLDELAVLLLRANYALAEERARDLLPRDREGRLGMRRVLLESILLVDERARRDGGLFSGTGLMIPTPFGPVLSRGRIPWPPEPQD